MKKAFFITAAFTLLILANTQAAFAKKKNSENNSQKVYMFGVSTSFLDSVAYVTNIQTPDSLVLNKEGFLPDMQEYSLQLKLFMENNRGLKDRLCSVFYDTSLKAIKKKLKKVENRLQNKEKLHMEYLESFAFEHYKAEE